MEDAEVQNLKTLVATLKKRVVDREHAIAIARKDGKANSSALEAIHQAHIDEIEYLLDDLEQMFPESR